MGKEKAVTVTTTPTLLLDINPLRKEYIIQNQDPAVDLYLGKSKNVATSGTRIGRKLTPNGLESTNDKENPELIKEEMYGVVSAGSITVWVWEA